MPNNPISTVGFLGFGSFGLREAEKSEMYGSPAMNKDLNLPFQLSPYRSAPNAVLGEVCEEADATFPRFAPPDPRDYLGEKQSGSAGFFQWHQPPQQEPDQHPQQMQNLSGGGGGSGLLRHGSSPAGLFGAGFAGATGIGTGVLGFASRQGSLMSQISEEDAGGTRRLLSGYPVASWDDSGVVSHSFSKRIKDPSEVHNGELRSHQQVAGGLAHHLSLPKNAVEMTAMERFLQFQDAVPCKVRSKRGCATHPRSIAERVRRTRISERIKKLQELVPNMDKQTNTADMLDLAVDYIKDLQRQAKVLSDGRANCTCSSRHKP